MVIYAEVVLQLASCEFNRKKVAELVKSCSEQPKSAKVMLAINLIANVYLPSYLGQETAK